MVIKHRAPNGALRLHLSPFTGADARHKAPSAKRCIKTSENGPDQTWSLFVIKHRAPNGALRRTGARERRSATCRS